MFTVKDSKEKVKCQNTLDVSFNLGRLIAMVRKAMMCCGCYSNSLQWIIIRYFVQLGCNILALEVELMSKAAKNGFTWSKAYTRISPGSLDIWHVLSISIPPLGEGNNVQCKQRPSPPRCQHSPLLQALTSLHPKLPFNSWPISKPAFLWCK